MTLSDLIAFNAALLVAMASPGPALIHAIQASLSRGRWVGVQTGLGLGAMAAVWTLMALLGLDALFVLFPWAYATMKVGGALYLMFVAWTTWRDAGKPVADISHRKARPILSGMLLNLGNPKSVLFAAAVLVVIFPAGLDAVDQAVITLNHLVVEVSFYGVIATMMSTPIVRQRYLRAKPLLDRVAAFVLATFGVRLLADRS